ncbi:unnamed protein product [Calypogeia fissa]
MDEGASSSSFRQLNNSLYELHRPLATPRLQVLLFHGFQLGNYEDAHLSTWKSGDGSCIWPQTWLVEEFPDAHILSVSYHASLMKRRESANIDLFIIAENIMSDLLQANIGQGVGCQVILVGHSFGGLVIKEVCLHAHKKGSVGNSKHESFLKSVKGLFFYSTPHHGIASRLAERFVQQGPLLEYVKTLGNGAARLNYDFDKLLHFFNNWRTGGVGENLPMKWSVLEKFVVVEEASSRYGDDFRIVLDADHISICRPMKKTSTSFNTLTRFLGGFSDISRIPGNFQHLPNSMVGVADVMEEMKQYLRSAATLGLVGMGGIGKSTLAKALFNDLERYYEYTCFLRDVKNRTKKVEDLVLENIHFRGKNNTQEGGGLGRLSGKLLLLVLDDVASAQDLEILSVLRDDYCIHPDSRVLVTSRDSGLLISEHLDRVHNVSFLSSEVSKQLLLTYAFPKGGLSSFERYADGVVQKCRGLPLTLEVVGKYLCQKNEVIWEQVIKALDRAEAVVGFDEKLWAKLRLSYDGLDKEEQEMFLTAATIFYDSYLDYAKAGWSMSTSGLQDMRWQHLVDLSLVWETPSISRVGDSLICVGMHEQLLSLGRKIAGNLGGGRVYVECKDQLALAQLRGEDNIQDIVCLEVSIPEDDTFEDAYEGEGDNVKVSSSTSATHNNGNQTAAKNLTTLFRSLKQFLKFRTKEEHADRTAWQKRHKEIRFDVKSSKVLHIPIYCDGRLMYPIEGPRFKSQVTPNYNLCLSCFQTNGSNPSEYVCIDRPAELLGQQLSIPGSKLCKMGKLRYLSLKNVGIDQTHGVAPALPSTLLYLNLVLGNFFELPFNPSHHKLMSALALESSLELRGLPTNFGQLSSLQMLSICAPQLETLPDSLGQLPMLKILEINSCNHLAKIPETLGDLVALEQLGLVSCNALSALPESVGRLTRLRNLNIMGCCRFFELLETFLQLQGLDCIVLLNTYLHSVPNLENLRSLKTLRVKWVGTAKFPVLPLCLQKVISEQNYVHTLQFKVSDGQFLPAEGSPHHSAEFLVRNISSMAHEVTLPLLSTGICHRQIQLLDPKSERFSERSPQNLLI